MLGLWVLCAGSSAGTGCCVQVAELGQWVLCAGNTAGTVGVVCSYHCRRSCCVVSL